MRLLFFTDPEDYEDLISLLKDRGHDVISVTEADLALKEAERADVVFIDLRHSTDAWVGSSIFDRDNLDKVFFGITFAQVVWKRFPRKCFIFFYFDISAAVAIEAFVYDVPPVKDGALLWASVSTVMRSYKQRPFGSEVLDLIARLESVLKSDALKALGKKTKKR